MSQPKLPSKSSKPAPSTRPPKSYRFPFPFKQVMQFEIGLNDIEPKIWRRIQVPDTYTFWDLHCAITDCLGWLDYHLHQFEIPTSRTGKKGYIGIPDDDGISEFLTHPGWKKKIATYFNKPGKSCQYEYDFGDRWRHTITLEAVLPKEKGARYPRCIAGERACPPEDCGGTGGYGRFLTAINYMNAKDHDELLQWAGGWFDPEWFDLSLVRFEDPDLRFEISFNDAPLKKGMRLVQYHRMHKTS